VAEKAFEWGIPLLAMIYPRGEKIGDEYDPKVVKHAARLGAELGADVVKVSYTGSPETFRQVVEGCHVPVIIAGGPRMDSDRDILEMVKGAMDAGAAGTSIGRNVFQHQNPTGIVRALSMIVHEKATVEQALQFMEES
jgi:class I fructose-bisphosphate aldolase